jgi:hypothetical protein
MKFKIKIKSGGVICVVKTAKTLLLSALALISLSACGKLAPTPTSTEPTYHTAENKAQYRQIAEAYANIDIIFDDTSFPSPLLSENAKSGINQAIAANKAVKADWDKTSITKDELIAAYTDPDDAEAIAELQAALKQSEYEIVFDDENHANPRVEVPDYYTLYLYPGVSNEEREETHVRLTAERTWRLNYIYYLDGGVIANVTYYSGIARFIYLDLAQDGTVKEVSEK